MSKPPPKVGQVWRSTGTIRGRYKVMWVQPNGERLVLAGPHRSSTLTTKTLHAHYALIEEPPVRHNHPTRDIRPRGACPACDEYHASQDAKKEQK